MISILDPQVFAEPMSCSSSSNGRRPEGMTGRLLHGRTYDDMPTRPSNLAEQQTDPLNSASASLSLPSPPFAPAAVPARLVGLLRASGGRPVAPAVFRRFALIDRLRRAQVLTSSKSHSNNASQHCQSYRLRRWNGVPFG